MLLTDTAPIAAASGNSKGAALFWGYLRQFWTSVCIATCLACAAVACQLVVPLLFRFVIDECLLGGRVSELSGASAAILVVSAGGFSLDLLQQWVFARMGGSVLYDLRMRVARHHRMLALAETDRIGTGPLLGLHATDATLFAQSYRSMLSEGLPAAIRLVGTLAVVGYLYPVGLVIGGAAMLACAAIARYVQQPLGRALAELQERQAAITGAVAESLAATRDVVAMNAWRADLSRLQREFAAAIEPQVRVAVLRQVMGLSTIVYAAAGAGIYWLGGLRVAAGGLTIGALAAMFRYVGLIQQPVAILVSVAAEMKMLAASADRIGTFLAVAPQPPPSPRAPLSPIRGSIEFRRVSFAYDGDRESGVRDVSFSVRAGRSLAIVGSSGAGKTTLLHLLLRLYESQGGSIAIDGHDIRDVPVRTLRSWCAVAFQHPHLLTASIADNIRFGRDDMPRDDVERAATIAGADEFVGRTPRGYQTIVGPGGHGLSAGQTQRLALARAFARRAPILLLDEATAAVDTQSELEIRRALKVALGDARQTRIIVTHRLVLAKECDAILVMHRGHVCGVGSHDELMRRCAEYVRLVEAEAHAVHGPAQASLVPVAAYEAMEGTLRSTSEDR